MKFINRNIWWVGLIIFLYPFYLPLLNKIADIHLELYTYGLEVKDFMIIWVAVGGIIGVVFNIALTQKRLTEQEQLLNKQEQRYIQQIETQYQHFKEQNDKQVEQVKIHHKQSRDNRFSLGVELLGNTNESARIGGAFNLYFLANEFKEYRKTACEILCAHIRTITNKQEYKIKYTEKPSNEIQTILDLLFKDEYGLIFDRYDKNLSEAIFNGANFTDATLSNVNLRFSAISNANFYKARLTDVKYSKATLSQLDFGFAILNNVDFFRATLNNVDFNSATLRKIIFSFAAFQDNVDFTGTSLANIPLKEIVRPNRSLDLTNE